MKTLACELESFFPFEFNFSARVGVQAIHKDLVNIVRDALAAVFIPFSWLLAHTSIWRPVVMLFE